MKDLFPKLPADLSSATDDELAALHAEHVDTIAKIRSQDPDTYEGREATEVVDQLRAGVEQFKALEAEQAERVAAQENFQATIESLTSDIDLPSADAETAAEETPEEPTAEAETEDEEPETETEPTAETEVEVQVETETVTASAPKRLALPPRAKAQHQPRPASEPGVAHLVASSGLPGVQAGEVLDREGLARAMQAAMRTMTSRSNGERVILASAQFEYPEERRLDSRGNPEENMEKIRAVTSPQAIVAAGGLCAPLTPIYDIPSLADDDRPVWDGLPKFQADRGGITFPTPISLADARGAITRVTAAQDEAGGSSATKSCWEVDCDDFQEAVVDAIAGCVTFSNMGARAWPERVDRVTQLVRVAHAEEGEVGLLDAISAGSTKVTGGAEYGATATLLRHILLAAAAYRSRNRMRPDRPLSALLPSWTADMLVADLVSSEFERFDRSQAGVEALLREFRVNVSFYMDGTTTGGQVFGSQSAGAMTDWINTVQWFLYAEGTWIGLDMGRIDLGVVRDSVLNATNKYQMFFETFEGIAKTGVESIQVTSTVCPNGAVAAPTTALTCS